MDQLTLREIMNEKSFMHYIVCKSCNLWTPIYCMSLNTLCFHHINFKGLCLLCDKSIPRERFINIPQVSTDD